MEPFVILLIMAAVSFFNWLMKRKQEADEAAKRAGQAPPSKPERAARPRPVRPRKSEDERLREFMEALGVPKEALPKPRPQPQAPPPIPRQPAPVRRQVLAEPAPVPPLREAIPEAPAEPAPAPTVPSLPAKRDAYRLTAASESAATVPAVELRDVLQTRTGFRTAFLLKEILGPPKSLQRGSDVPGLS